MKHPQIGLAIPPLGDLGIDTTGLDRLLEELGKYVEQRRNVEGRIRGAEDGLAEARRADDRAYAKALQDGKDAPEPKHLKEAEAKIEELRRRERALGTLIEQLTEEARRHILENAGAWKKKAEKALPKASERYEKAVEELVAARGDFYATWSAVEWTEDPYGKYTPRGAESPVTLGLEKGVGLGSPQSVHLGPVLEAMRHEIRGPEREAAKKERPLVEMRQGQPQRRVS